MREFINKYTLGLLKRQNWAREELHVHEYDMNVLYS